MCDVEMLMWRHTNPEYVQVYADATVVFPLIVAATFAKVENDIPEKSTP